MAMARMSKQSGITFLGLIFVATLVAMVGVVAAQVTPTVIEYVAVQKAAQKSTEGQTPADVRLIFAKAVAIEDIKSITPEQIEISKQGDKVVVSFAYEREIHLVGPAYLTLKYKGQSK